MDEYQLQHTGAELDTAIQLMLDNGTITPDTPTSVSGLLKGSGGKISPAIAGTDYATPAQVNDKLDKTGGEVSGDLLPDVGGTRYLGSETKRWNALHAYTGYFNADILMGSANTPVASSGSDDNGRWIKFYDGTLICTNRFTWSFNMSTAWGSLYYGVYIADFTFPSPFSVLDHFGLSFRNGDIIGMSMMDKLPDLNGFNGRVMATTVSPQTQNANVSYIAVGRWK